MLRETAYREGLHGRKILAPDSRTRVSSGRPLAAGSRQLHWFAAA